jgi:hypothetical protein
MIPNSGFYLVDFEEDHENQTTKSTPIDFRNADLCAEADCDDSIFRDDWVRVGRFDLVILGSIQPIQP